jgi:hypothetical protein
VIDNVKNGESLISPGGLPLIVKLLEDPEEDIQKMAAGVIGLLSTLEGKTYHAL